MTESEAPFIYTLLGDALLRFREVDQALVILNEAAAAVAGQSTTSRSGSAPRWRWQASAPRHLPKIEPYLDRHPDDPSAISSALRLLYQARADGKPIESTNEDRALFTKWATAYAAAKGPQLALVEQWQKVMAK